MLQMDTGGTFIDFLSAFPAASNEFFFNIILEQIAVMHPPLKLLPLSLRYPKINHNILSRTN
jgi:hypothetical protein